MIKLSACVIVKDEEVNLPRWLECMQAVADEIIVVDTGSTDRTVQLAMEAGASVYHFAWIHDFSAAKNYAIEQATGDWIIMLDADEYIPPSQYAAVRRSIEQYHSQPQIIGLVSNQINIDADKHDNYISSGYQIRIFRNLSKLRYVRPIHEVLQYRGKSQKRMQLEESFSIYHTGYSSRRIRQKLERNLELLLDKVARGEKQAADDYYLQDCYYGLGDYEKALEYAKRASLNKIRTLGGENRSYAVWIQCMIYLHHPVEEIASVVAQAREKFPEAAEFQLQLGFAYWQQRDYCRAENCFLQGLKVHEAFQSAESTKLLQLEDEASSLLPDVYADLAKIRRWQGKKEEALQYIQLALQQNRYHRESCQQLLRLLADLPDAEVIEVFNGLFDKQADSVYLAEIMQRGERPRAQLYYSRLGKLALSELEQYILAGNMRAAGAELALEMHSLFCLGCLTARHSPDIGETLQVLLPGLYQQVLQGGGDPAVLQRLERMQGE